MVLSDSAGVYLIDTNTGAVVQSYGSIFSGTSAQDLGQDMNGNLYVSNASGHLIRSLFNPGAPTPATAYGAATDLGAIAGVTGINARLAFDPTTAYCAAGCLVTTSNATTVIWIDPSTAAVKRTLTLSKSVATNGDIVVAPTSAVSETLYVVATHNLYTINASTGSVSGPVTLSGPTGSLTGLALLPNGDLAACEQVGSGSPWTLWEYTTAGGLVTSHAGISTGSDVVNDLASVPAVFSVVKSGTTAAGPGDSLFYQIALKNTGFFTYPTGSIVDPVPATITVSTTTPPACAVAGGTGSCSITSAAGAQTVTASVTNLSAGATATMTINGSTSSTSGSATNVAQGSVPFDPNEYGGQTVTSNPVVTNFTAANFVKQVTNITESLGPANKVNGLPEDVLEYTLTFTNHRAFALQSFLISDAIPPHTAYVAGSATCATTPAPLTCAPNESGGLVTFTYSGGSLATNGVIVAKFRVTIV